MIYYIINNRIIEYTYELDTSLYSYSQLSTEQSLFYEQHPNASLSEILAMELNPPYVKTLDDYKNEKRGEIQNAFYTAVNNGYYDTTLDVTIRIADEDRNQFNQRITLVNLIPNEMKPATTTITDINSEPVTLTLQDFFTLMLYMGMYYDNLWGKKATIDKQIKDATTIEELDNIIW